MGFEPTTASLEGWNSTTELRPPTVNLPTLHDLSAPCLAQVRARHIASFTIIILTARMRSGSNWWAGKDSNLGSHKAADLQSAPFVHLGTCPSLIARLKSRLFLPGKSRNEAVSFCESENEVSPTTHSFPAKRQGWGADEMRIDLALKAADFICHTFHCQGGMFCAGRILAGDGSRASPLSIGIHTAMDQHKTGLTY
jgi:hypothetical protein